MRLRSGAGFDDGLTLRQASAGGVGAEPGGISDRGKHGKTGGAKNYRDAALAIIGRAAHPATLGIGRRPGLLFSNRKSRSGCGAVKLVETNAGAIRAGCRGDRVVCYQRLVGAEVAVRQAIHHTVADRIDEAGGCRRRRLRYGVARIRNRYRIESSDGQRTAYAFGKGRIGRNGEVHMKIKDSQLVAGFTELTGLEISEGTRRPRRRWNITFHNR